jgi:hypothetical protein
LVVTVPGQKNKHIRKLKGVSMRFNNSEECSIDTLRMLVDGKIDKTTFRLLRTIERDSTFNIFTREIGFKSMTVVFDKRERVGLYNTQPWGYREDYPTVEVRADIDIPEWKFRKHTKAEYADT